MQIIYDDGIFDHFQADQKSRVFEIMPDVFSDSRGSFSEVLKCRIDMPEWMSDMSWIRQINRSVSGKNTVRGCHAQKGKFCQAKLVEALTVKIYDIITDARPDSDTFGVSKAYLLDPMIQNKLFVPRGFLHSFVVPETETPAVFQYFCDNDYDKSSEVCVNPLSVLPELIRFMKDIASGDAVYAKKYEDLFNVFNNEPLINVSEKDRNAFNYETWMAEVINEYNESGKVWYK